MRWLTMPVAIVAALLFTATAYAQEIQRDVVIFGDDIDFVKTQNARACQRACRDDRSCKAWTFVKPTGQCRLKSSVYRTANSRCCNSGTIARPKARSIAAFRVRVTRCEHKFERNRHGWRERRWRRSDCTNGLPPAGAEAIGQAVNGNGTGGQADCTPTSGRHFNHERVHGATSGTVICLYIAS